MAERPILRTIPAPLPIHLSQEENEELRHLSLSDNQPQVVKLRAIALRLNADGWNVPAIAKHLNQHEQTIRTALKRRQHQGFADLWDAPRSERPCRWQASDLAEVKAWLQEPRSYMSRQLCEKFQQERQVSLSPRQISRVLKKRVSLEATALLPLSPERPVLCRLQTSRLAPAETVGRRGHNPAGLS
ncbi:MAG: helix-turn-helix domain-containing protein [Cyanobacteria bacterium P01_H01_bin.15]